MHIETTLAHQIGLGGACPHLQSCQTPENQISDSKGYPHELSQTWQNLPSKRRASTGVRVH